MERRESARAAIVSSGRRKSAGGDQSGGIHDQRTAEPGPPGAAVGGEGAQGSGGAKAIGTSQSADPNAASARPAQEGTTHAPVSGDRSRTKSAHRHRHRTPGNGGGTVQISGLKSLRNENECVVSTAKRRKLGASASPWCRRNINYSYMIGYLS